MLYVVSNLLAYTLPEHQKPNPVYVPLQSLVIIKTRAGSGWCAKILSEMAVSA